MNKIISRAWLSDSWPEPCANTLLNKENTEETVILVGHSAGLIKIQRNICLLGKITKENQTRETSESGSC